MCPYPMTDVIAQREYSLSAGGKDHPVVLLIGRPAPRNDGPHPSWYCPWIIRRSGKDKLQCAVGEDSVQALLLALSGLRTDLSLIARKGKLSFIGLEGPGIDLVG